MATNIIQHPNAVKLISEQALNEVIDDAKKAGYTLPAKINPFAQKLTGFKGWSLIKFYFSHNNLPVRREKDYEHLQNILDSGLMVTVPYDPSYSPYMHLLPQQIDEYVWLKPTDLGMACYHVYAHLNTQLINERDATRKAYKQGKIDALKVFIDDMATKLGVDVDEIYERDDIDF